VRLCRAQLAAHSRGDASAALHACHAGATAALCAGHPPVLHPGLVLVGLWPRVGAHGTACRPRRPPLAAHGSSVPTIPTDPYPTQPALASPRLHAQAAATHSAARSWRRCRRATAWQRQAPGAAWRPRSWRRRAACPAARRARPGCRRRPQRAWRACWTARCKYTLNSVARARRVSTQGRSMQ